MKLRAFAPILFLACVSVSLPAFAQVTEADDAYHFQDWQGSPQNLLYTEWWYFNFYDQADDLQAIFTYQVIDPLNLAKAGGAFVSAVAYQGSDVATAYENVPLTSFHASSSAANVLAGSNVIAVLGPNNYVIAGSTSDGRMSWRLEYIRTSQSWFGADRVGVGGPDWEKMSWLVYMPRAQVSGTLTLDGKTYQVNCPGYHDHNWGQWNFLKVQWNWAQYSQAGLIFDLGDFPGNPNGRARINVAGQPTTFSASQYKLIHTKWAYDAVNGLAYPTESLFTANNGTTEASIKISVQKTDPLASGPPPALVIYEQPSRFSGFVRDLTGAAPPVTFAGNGFSEYTGKSSKP